MNYINQIEPYITDNEARAVSEYLSSGGWLTEFKKTEELERMIADYLGVKYAVILTSGTVGLYLALLSLGIGEGDKVLVPNYTMIASINAIRWAKAEPVIVDVDRENLCMDIGKIKVSPDCKAMMYVSVNGRSHDMSKVSKFCRDNRIFLIEDACQSLGSFNCGKPLGSFGEAGVFSFTIHKTITTGQGGAVVTDSEEIFNKVAKLKDFSRVKKGEDLHDGIGYNFKFTDLQAVIGIEQMKIIDFRVKRKKEIFERYVNALSGVKEIEIIPTDTDQTLPWFMDIILSSQDVRNKLGVFLKEQKIGSRVFYPPINHQEPYSYYPKGSFPVSESVANRGLWLPSSIGLENEQIDYTCSKIKDFFTKK